MSRIIRDRVLEHGRYTSGGENPTEFLVRSGPSSVEKWYRYEAAPSDSSGEAWASLVVRPPAGGTRPELGLLYAETKRGRLRGLVKKLLGTCLRQQLDRFDAGDFRIVFRDVVNPGILDFYKRVFGDLVRETSRRFSVVLPRERLEEIAEELLSARVKSREEQRERALELVNSVLEDVNWRMRGKLEPLLASVVDKKVDLEGWGDRCRKLLDAFYYGELGRRFVDASHALVEENDWRFLPGEGFGPGHVAAAEV